MLREKINPDLRPTLVINNVLIAKLLQILCQLSLIFCIASNLWCIEKSRNFEFFEKHVITYLSYFHLNFAIMCMCNKFFSEKLP